ncbi:hypothetical protein DYQ86_16205 [Acidobacteria bacterium AB60]|nr:hypothetical protein DYQ86_16205 [Acidobacteria bacterium AB60]
MRISMNQFDKEELLRDQFALEAMKVIMDRLMEKDIKALADTETQRGVAVGAYGLADWMIAARRVSINKEQRERAEIIRVGEDGKNVNWLTEAQGE